MSEPAAEQPEEQIVLEFRDENDVPIPDSVWQGAVQHDEYYHRPREYVFNTDGLDEETLARMRQMIDSRPNPMRIMNGVIQATNAHDSAEMSQYDRLRRLISDDVAALAEETDTPPRFIMNEPLRAQQRYRESGYQRVARHHMSGWQRLNEQAEQARDIPAIPREDFVRDAISIPMEGLEQVDVDQINSIVENRRVHSAFGRILQELGLGSESADQDFTNTMSKAITALKELKRNLASATLALQRFNDFLPPDPVVGPDKAVHGHDTQWRILNLEDEVLETSEWAEGSDGDYARDAMRQRLSDWQLQGQDVYLAEYHRCRWVNLTTKKERER